MTQLITLTSMNGVNSGEFVASWDSDLNQYNLYAVDKPKELRGCLRDIANKGYENTGELVLKNGATIKRYKFIITTQSGGAWSTKLARLEKMSVIDLRAKATKLNIVGRSKLTTKRDIIKAIMTYKK